jgi:hypothetical protein
MISTFMPARRQRSRTVRTALASVPGGGVRMHQRWRNSSGNPASGPECSVPATGWPGTTWTCLGSAARIASRARVLHEPTSVTMAPALRCGAIAAQTGPIASIGTQTTTRSAPWALLPASASARSTKPSSSALARTAGFASWPTISPARRCCFSTQPSDAPIKPSPISVTRSKWTGASVPRGMG